jgi:hypothetical protein
MNKHLLWPVFKVLNGRSRCSRTINVTVEALDLLDDGSTSVQPTVHVLEMTKNLLWPVSMFWMKDTGVQDHQRHRWSSRSSTPSKDVFTRLDFSSRMQCRPGVFQGDHRPLFGQGVRL